MVVAGEKGSLARCTPDKTSQFAPLVVKILLNPHHERESEMLTYASLLNAKLYNVYALMIEYIPDMSSGCGIFIQHYYWPVWNILPLDSLTEETSFDDDDLEIMD